MSWIDGLMKITRTNLRQRVGGKQTEIATPCCTRTGEGWRRTSSQPKSAVILQLGTRYCVGAPDLSKSSSSCFPARSTVGEQAIWDITPVNSPKTAMTHEILQQKHSSEAFEQNECLKHQQHPLVQPLSPRSAMFPVA